MCLMHGDAKASCASTVFLLTFFANRPRERFHTTGGGSRSYARALLERTRANRGASACGSQSEEGVLRLINPSAAERFRSPSPLSRESLTRAASPTEPAKMAARVRNAPFENVHNAFVPREVAKKRQTQDLKCRSSVDSL